MGLELKSNTKCRRCGAAPEDKGGWVCPNCGDWPTDIQVCKEEVEDLKVKKDEHEEDIADLIKRVTALEKTLAALAKKVGT
jgi:ribosomal protein L37E